MSVWSLLLACQGFIHDGPAGLIGFRPLWKPEDHASFWSGAEGWGLFTQKREASRQAERIEVRHGKLQVKSLVFELPKDAKPSKLSVALGDQPLDATHELVANRLTITLAARATVAAGDALSIEARW